MSETTQEEPASPLGPSTVTGTVSRNCPARKTPLEADWSHCPRCGTAAQTVLRLIHTTLREQGSGAHSALMLGAPPTRPLMRALPL